jgi:homoserine kinase
VAKPEPITFHVPASAANIGPGYGVLAVAVDLPRHITVEPRDDGAIVIERSDRSIDDPRHEPVLRGLRAGLDLLHAPTGKGMTVRIEGTIPRGTGLGTISAGFAAGLGTAVRIARKPWTSGQVLDQLVQLGGDPAHGAASMLGGLCAAVPIGGGGEPHLRPMQFPIHGGWRAVVALPDIAIGTAESKRVLPPTLPHAVASRTSGRVLGILTALAHGDEQLLRQCLVDELHVPYRKQLSEGLDAALQAGLDSGAAGTTICGHGPSLLALTTDAARAPVIARAMVDAFARAHRQATSLILQVAHYGALPLQA